MFCISVKNELTLKIKIFRKKKPLGLSCCLQKEKFFLLRSFLVFFEHFVFILKSYSPWSID